MCHFHNRPKNDLELLSYFALKLHFSQLCSAIRSPPYHFYICKFIESNGHPVLREGLRALFSVFITTTDRGWSVSGSSGGERKLIALKKCLKAFKNSQELVLQSPEDYLYCDPDYPAVAFSLTPKGRFSIVLS